MVAILLLKVQCDIFCFPHSVECQLAPERAVVTPDEHGLMSLPSDVVWLPFPVDNACVEWAG